MVLTRSRFLVLGVPMSLAPNEYRLELEISDSGETADWAASCARRSSQWEATDVEDDPAADLLPYCAPAFDQRIAR